MASQRVALDPLQGDDGVAASGRPGGAQRLAGEPVALPTATGRRRAEHVRVTRRQQLSWVVKHTRPRSHATASDV